MRENKENQLDNYLGMNNSTLRRKSQSKQNYKANFQFHEITQKMKIN